MTFIYIMDMNKIGLILGGVAVAVNAAAELPQLTYPVAERQDVVDDYFGTKVADPYRWLENDTSAQTAASPRRPVSTSSTTPSSLRWRIDRRTGEQKPPLFIMQRMVRRGGIFEEHDVGLRCKIRMKRRTAPGREALSRALWTWGNTDRRLGCTSLKITNCFRKFT